MLFCNSRPEVSAPSTVRVWKPGKGQLRKEESTGCPIPKNKAVIKAMGLSDATPFMFLLESSSDNLCERRNILTYLWMASRCGVAGGSCLTAHGNTAQQLGQEVKKATPCWDCRGGIEVRRMPCLQAEFNLLPRLDVLYQRWPSGRARAGFLRRRVLLKAVVQCTYWCIKTAQRQENVSARTPSSQCSGMLCQLASGGAGQER